MRTRRRLLQKWRYAIDVCLVGVRKTSREVLARFVVGMLLGGDVLLVHVAQALPHHVRTASVERRLRRCLANQRVVGERWWPPLVQPQLPARRVAAWLIECEVTLVADQGFTGPDSLVSGVGLALGVARECRFDSRAEADRWLSALGSGGDGGQRVYPSTRLFRRADWILVKLGIFWKQGYDAPWILVSDGAAGTARHHAGTAHTV